MCSMAGFHDTTRPSAETTRIPSEVLPITSERWLRCSMVSLNRRSFSLRTFNCEARASTNEPSAEDSGIARCTARIAETVGASPTDAMKVVSPGRVLTSSSAAGG